MTIAKNKPLKLAASKLCAHVKKYILFFSPLPYGHSLQDATGEMVTLTQLEADEMRIVNDNFSQKIIC